MSNELDLETLDRVQSEGELNDAELEGVVGGKDVYPGRGPRGGFGGGYGYGGPRGGYGYGGPRGGYGYGGPRGPRGGFGW